MKPIFVGITMSAALLLAACAEDVAVNPGPTASQPREISTTTRAPAPIPPSVPTSVEFAEYVFVADVDLCGDLCIVDVEVGVVDGAIRVVRSTSDDGNTIGGQSTMVGGATGSWSWPAAVNDPTFTLAYKPTKVESVRLDLSNICDLCVLESTLDTIVAFEPPDRPDLRPSLNIAGLVVEPDDDGIVEVQALVEISESRALEGESWTAKPIYRWTRSFESGPDDCPGEVSPPDDEGCDVELVGVKGLNILDVRGDTRCTPSDQDDQTGFAASFGGGGEPSTPEEDDSLVAMIGASKGYVCTGTITLYTFDADFNLDGIDFTITGLEAID